MLWYDGDQNGLTTVANTFLSGLNPTDTQVTSIILARICLQLTNVASAIESRPVPSTPPAPPYQPPIVDAQDLADLSRAITQLNETIFRASPEQRGLVFQADKPVEVPE